MLRKFFIGGIILIFLIGIVLSMSISPVSAQGGQFDWTLLKFLNADNIASLANCPNFLSSPPPGKLNAEPQWYTISLSLSKYAGKLVYVAFKFDTGDGLYNCYQGWYIKNIYNGPFKLDDGKVLPFWTKSDSGHGPKWYYTNGSWRYADPSTGTYQGKPIATKCSDTRNYGWLITPAIYVISNYNSTLKFTTKWQIETESPVHYDRMEVYVATGDIKDLANFLSQTVRGISSGR